MIIKPPHVYEKNLWQCLAWQKSVTENKKIEEEVIVAAHCRVCCALHSRSDNHLIQ